MTSMEECERQRAELHRRFGNEVRSMCLHQKPGLQKRESDEIKIEPGAHMQLASILKKPLNAARTCG
jgi:hypothetical protein